jgi:hypothetical protein
MVREIEKPWEGGPMDELDGKATERPGHKRVVFSGAFYLFGAVVTSLTFAFLMQFILGPHWGERFLRGWIDPSLNLIAIPLLGAVLGLVMMMLLNVSYVLIRARSRS